HPNLPEDFDFAYWNAAPADQQINWPAGNFLLDLTNLTPSGLLRTALPGHRAFVLARMHSGQLLPLPMRTDTLIIDTDALTITLVHRLSVPADAPIRVLEARFETEPAAPLLKFADEESNAAAPTEYQS
ncbi:DUF2169 domain-containing protein, partial [Chitinibacter sp. GC72]|uniref:DUF2169 domain-containing protein n=1 Tax=Chitinibacter sp. GC72 TaxID=1526917 RepID=UPI0012FC6D29